MKISALILLLVILKSGTGNVALTSLYSGTDFVEQFEYFKSGITYLLGENLVYGGKTTAIQLKNATDLACSTSQKKCIVSTDFVFKEFTLDESAGLLKHSKTYKVREQTKFRIYSKVVFIEGSQYFLGSSLSKYGVNRFKLGTDDRFTQLKFPGISETMECIDILVYPKSKYALVSFSGFKKICLIDFVAMNEVRMIPGEAGFLAPLSQDLSQGYFVSARENNITKYKLTDGTMVGSIMIDYIVTGMKNVENTDLVIVATWEQVFVYNFAGTNTTAWAASPYYYEMLGKQMTGGVLWNQAEATMYFSGYGHITSLTGVSASFCHPFCNGCSMMLSEYKCNACTAPATMDGSVCKLPSSSEQIKTPPGGVINYQSAQWSEENMKPEAAKGFNIKDYYLYIIIGAGGLVGICCIFCICKMCCKKEEDQRNNRVGQQNKDC